MLKVLNCPAYNHKSCECAEYGYDCTDITDCLLKRIVKDCKQFRELQDGDAINVGQSYAGLAILQQIQIEECE